MKKTEKLLFNKTVDKTEIKNIINWFLQNYGSIRTKKLVDELKELGFKNATSAGISIGLEDLLIPKTKYTLIKNTEKVIEKSNKKNKKGIINMLSHIENLTENWNITNEIIKNEVINNFRQINLLNSIYIMALSGARGNISQIKQLVGMRGLMADSKGEIINLPIKSNFKEGLNLIEYFISCYGARKGLVDTALKTANSGYLTRRLIYVSQGEIIKKPDCNSMYKTIILIKKNNKKEYLSLKDKLIGRVIGKDIKETKTKKIIAMYGQDICNV